MTPIVNIILPVYNRREVTERFIECLIAQSYIYYRLLLIDDGSSDGTYEMVKSKVNNLAVIKGKGDWWWAGSLQQGIKWLEKNEADDNEIVMFANDDVTFDESFLQKAIEILNGENNIFLLPQVYDEKTDMIIESGVEADLSRMTFKPATSKKKINCLPTRCLFMRITDLKKVGGFRPRILPHYWSDYEFTIRAFRKGIQLRTSQDIVIIPCNETTGFRKFNNTNFLKFIKNYFSKRSVGNPIYSSVFILLTNSLLYKPLNIVKIWFHALLYILRQLRAYISQRLQKIKTLKAIDKYESKLKIILGSSGNLQDGWISTDYPILDLTDEETFHAMFKPDSVSNFLAEHVWEHLTLDEAAIACQICFKFLKKDSTLRIAVPDGFHSDIAYISQVKPGGYGPGADSHMVLYNYKTLSTVLINAGFEVKLLEWHDENGSFHSENWDIENGMIKRSSRYDLRNKKNPTAYTSLIIDAIKL